jgi:vacuolar-type H+-ATPase subunit H
MPTRLSELLERIRPAGAPGAPHEGERQRQADDRAGEIIDVLDLLVEFEAEARTVLADGHKEADRVLSNAHRQASAGRASLPDLMAQTEAEAAHRDDRRLDDREETIRQRADEAIELLETRADAEIRRLADRAVEIIISSILDPEDDRP